MLNDEKLSEMVSVDNPGIEDNMHIYTYGLIYSHLLVNLV